MCTNTIPRENRFVAILRAIIGYASLSMAVHGGTVIGRYPWYAQGITSFQWGSLVVFSPLSHRWLCSSALGAPGTWHSADSGAADLHTLEAGSAARGNACKLCSKSGLYLW